MYMKRKIKINDNYCIKPFNNKTYNDGACIIKPIKRKISANVKGYTTTKDENQNYCFEKNKHKKEPLPMKLRTFPESFWQQPNKTSLISPGDVYFADESSLPKEGDTSANHTNEEEEEEKEIQLKSTQEIITQPNIDLLFSLFRNVESEEEKKTAIVSHAAKSRRGRPKKPKANRKVARDDDPYLTSSAADSFFPLLVKDSPRGKHYQAMSAKSLSITLQTINSTSSQNFSEMLSDLVVNL